MSGCLRHSCRLTLTLLFAGLASPLHAQDFDRVIPRPPEPETTPALPEVAPTPLSQDQTVLIPALRGVVIIGNPEAVREAGVDPSAVPQGVSVEGIPFLDQSALQARLQPYLGQPLTRARLDEITRAVDEIYRQSERPFVNISVPQQNVQAGVIQLVVTEYRVGEITVEGNRHFSTRQILRMADLQPGDTMTLPVLREALADYNSNPFLAVSAVTRPGAETGESDIVLEARDRFPVRVYAGYDNQGVPSLGRDEWFVGFNWGNAFGLGQILSYQYTESFEGRYKSHSLSHVIPLNPDMRVLLFGAYAEQRPFIAEIFDTKGKSGQASGRFSFDLPNEGDVEQTLQAGLDYKRADSNFEFAGFRLLDTAVEVFQFPLSYTLTVPDSAGSTAIEQMLVFSPGDVTKYNTDEAMRQLVPGADSTYAYYRLSLTRTTKLPNEMSWIVRAMGQLASSNLPYSEQLGAGGIGSVRGYDTNTALGSEGVLLSTELRFPTFDVLPTLGAGGWADDGLQLGLFLDYAWLRQHDRIPDLERSQELASAGVNLNYVLTRYASLQMAVGTQLITPPGQRNRDTRAAIVATVSY